jgi:hypothetical protein
MFALECSYDGTLNNFLIAPVRIDGLRSIRTQLQAALVLSGELWKHEYLNFSVIQKDFFCLK